MVRTFAFLLLTGASPAFAAPIGQASFAPGTNMPSKLVVDEAIWTCVDGRCAGPAEARTVAMQRACASLARQVGAVASLTVGAAALTPDAIEHCNAKSGRAPVSTAAK